MSQGPEEIPLTPFHKHEMELTKRANAHLREMAKTQTMSYIDEDGYIVRRSPDGTITKVSSAPVV
jgi:hypothetical protein